MQLLGFDVLFDDDAFLRAILVPPSHVFFGLLDLVPHILVFSLLRIRLGDDRMLNLREMHELVDLIITGSHLFILLDSIREVFTNTAQAQMTRYVFVLQAELFHDFLAVEVLFRLLVLRHCRTVWRLQLSELRVNAIPAFSGAGLTNDGVLPQDVLTVLNGVKLRVFDLPTLVYAGSGVVAHHWSHQYLRHCPRLTIDALIHFH